ncbi:MAG: flagellar basal body rod protein FlgC [Bacteroidetes bacterium]|nr:flagellar basal body rod protein FlgC [Bacteroidota bacterium]
MKIDQFFNGMNISAHGLSAQRKKMNAIASNIANAETTRTEDGGPYTRKVVLMSEKDAGAFGGVLQTETYSILTTDRNHIGTASVGTRGPGTATSGVSAEETIDESPFKMVYEPSHPDANEEGYVQMPNVNVVNEMVDMISATRSYEANVTAINAAKTMAKDSLEI